MVPVFPVARELLSKTKLTASKSGSQLDPRPLRKLKLKPTPKTDADSEASPIRPRSSSSGNTLNTLSPSFVGTIADESTTLNESDTSSTVADINRPSGRVRLLSVFSRGRRSLDRTPDVGGIPTSNLQELTPLLSLILAPKCSRALKSRIFIYCFRYTYVVSIIVIACDVRFGQP